MKIFDHIESKVMYDVPDNAPMVMDVVTEVLPPRRALAFQKKARMVRVHVTLGAEFVAESEERARAVCVRGIKHEVYGELLFEMRGLMREMSHTMPPNHPICKRLDVIIRKLQP